MATQSIRVVAPAKINLTLDVLGRRTDGYHELRSVMQTVALADDLEVAAAPDLDLQVEPEWLAGPDNLVIRAAEALRQRSGYGGGARFTLRKKVPIAAGLGGGSSDAAASLLALNSLWGLDLSGENLREVAAAVGSDVPFFLTGGTALVAGRGEQVQPLPLVPPCVVLLVRPPLSVSTAKVFGALSPDQYTDGTATAALVGMLAVPPAQWSLLNALQETAIRLYPIVGQVVQALQASGARPALMSGSGPTCFGFFQGLAAATAAAQQMRGRGWEAWVTCTVAGLPLP